LIYIDDTDEAEASRILKFADYKKILAKSQPGRYRETVR
jgi:hypothetical protein